MSVVPPKDKAFLDVKLVQECMDAHAKRIGISFLQWAIDNEKVVGNSAGTAFTNESEETLYNKFIESITK